MSRILFAGGGTAGHIEPALAVARSWKIHEPDSKILFVGTRQGLESRIVPESGFEIAYIEKVRIPRRISISIFLAPFTLLRSVMQALRLTRKSDVVVGFGGYVSAPIYIAAALTRTPIAIHEANARPGLANKLGSLFTNFVAITYPISSGRLSRARHTGLPLRDDVLNAYEGASHDWMKARTEAKRALGFNPDQPLIFIFGGSQGSIALNAVVIDSRKTVLEQGIQIFHGIGAKNEVPSPMSGYRGVSYINDMAQAYLAADVIISRSGAVTCAEVNTLGRYALFIPLPVGNGEQKLNASGLISQGRAEILPQSEFTSEWLISNIQRLISCSASAPIAGSDLDINAASKMITLIVDAMRGGK